MVSVFGMIFLVPVVVLGAARLGRRLPLPLRYAVRDAARHRTRTVPAVAAVAATVAGVVALSIANSSDQAQAQARLHAAPPERRRHRERQQPARRLAGAGRGRHPGRPRGRRATDRRCQRAVERGARGAGTSGLPGRLLRRRLIAGARQRRHRRGDRSLPRAGARRHAAEASGHGAGRGSSGGVHRRNASGGPGLDLGPRRPRPRDAAAARDVRRPRPCDGPHRGCCLRRMCGGWGSRPGRRGWSSPGARSPRPRRAPCARRSARLDPSAYLYVERGYQVPGAEKVVLWILFGMGGGADARRHPDRHLPGAVGRPARPRDAVGGRCVAADAAGVAAAYALAVGLVGAVLGAAVGFIPGIAITYPLTRLLHRRRSVALPRHPVAADRGPWWSRCRC